MAHIFEGEILVHLLTEIGNYTIIIQLDYPFISAFLIDLKKDGRCGICLRSMADTIIIGK